MTNEQKARVAIQNSMGTEDGEYGIDLFISHHLEELPATYWEEQLGTSSPTYQNVIDALVLVSKWPGEEIYDFSLPGNVTTYVVSVMFNELGAVESISMES